MEKIDKKLDKPVFISTEKGVALSIINTLKQKGIESDWSSYCGRYLIHVQKEDYQNALKVESQEITYRSASWINSYDEVIDNINVWPVAYCLLDLKKYCFKNTNPKLWMIDNEIPERYTKAFEDQTPDIIKGICYAIKEETNHAVFMHWNHADEAIEFRTICPINEHSTIQKAFLEKLKEYKLFDKIYPVAFDGTLDKEHSLSSSYQPSQIQKEYDNNDNQDIQQD